MQLKFSEIFLIFKVIAFELVAGKSLYWDENTCDRPSTC